jgi:predicted Rossmann fold flavoprotein
MCAAIAGQHGRSVCILEHNALPGKKIRISGGGRCNFTNIHTSPQSFLSENPHFCKSALARYTPSDFTTLVDHYNITYHEKTLGQLFCDESAQQIIDMLVEECHLAGCKFRFSTKVKSVKKSDDRFHVYTSEGNYIAESLVVASGGLSIPKLGASPIGYQIAEQFDLHIVPPRPALVPLTFHPEYKEIFGGLSGVSLESIASCGDAVFRENMLFTHKGISGPAILQISSYWDGTSPVEINLLPNYDIESFTAPEYRNTEMKTALSQMIPKRAAQVFCEYFVQNKVLKHYSQTELTDAVHSLQHWEIKPNGTQGYAKAEVTAGGVSTEELSSKTMETKKVQGLFFIGEVVDVTGWLGGYNFQWAWASGFVAGQNA